MTAARVGLITAAVLLASATLPASGAHEGGRAAFVGAEAAGDVVLLALLPAVPMAGKPIPLHVEVRNASTHALVDAGDTLVARVALASGGAARDVAFAAADPAGYAANVTFDEAGAWRMDVPWRDDVATLPFDIYPNSPYWVDYVAAAFVVAVAGRETVLPFTVVDDAGGRPAEAPRDARLWVERWDDTHESFLGRVSVPLDPTGNPGELVARVSFDHAGPHDVWVEAPSVGIGAGTQPALDVHVLPPRGDSDARAAPFAGVGAAIVALGAGAALGGLPRGGASVGKRER